MLSTWTAWLIPHLIANNSASVEVKMIAWWIDLARILWLKHICNIKVATLFLMLALEIIVTVFGSNRESSKIFLRLQMWVFLISFSLQFTVWKEKQLEKLSTNQKPDESSLWRLLKEEKRLLRWLLESTMKLLSFCCLEVKFSKDNQWDFIFFEYWFSRRELRA